MAIDWFPLDHYTALLKHESAPTETEALPWERTHRQRDSSTQALVYWPPASAFRNMASWAPQSSGRGNPSPGQLTFA